MIVLKIQKLIKVSNFYCEEIKKLRPGELGLHQSRMEGFCIVCVYIKGGGAMPMMEKWWCENLNKLVEQEALILWELRVLSWKRNFCLRFLWGLTFKSLILLTILSLHNDNVDNTSQPVQWSQKMHLPKKEIKRKIWHAIESKIPYIYKAMNYNLLHLLLDIDMEGCWKCLWIQRSVPEVS